MGPLMTSVLFEGSAPDMQSIVGALELRSGLAVKADVWKLDEASLHDVRGRVAFECEPKHSIEIEAYRQGAVRSDTEEMYGDFAPMVGPEFYKTIEGGEEPPGKQAIHLTSYDFDNSTLLGYLLLALEDLGGEFIHPLDEAERQRYALPTTPLALKESRLKSGLESLRLVWPISLLLPVIVVASSFGMDFSRSRLNAAAQQVHKRFDMPGEPEQIGWLDYVRVKVPVMLVGCLATIPAAIIGLIGFVLIPLVYLFGLARFGLFKWKLRRAAREGEGR